MQFHKYYILTTALTGLLMEATKICYVCFGTRSRVG
jgi:hypothetical protein